MKKLRFCMVTTFYPPFHPGGCGLHVYHLANLLAEDGHEVDVLCSAGAHGVKIKAARPGSYPHHPSVRVIRVPGGKPEAISTYLFGRGARSSSQIKKILQSGYDVIHYHNISLFGGIKSLDWGSGLKLFTQHTYWLICPEHYLWKMNREPCREKQCLACLISSGKPPVPWRLWRRPPSGLEMVDSLIMPCGYMIERHREEGFTGRMDLLPYFVSPVDLEAEVPEPERINRPFFLLVTRLEPYKGPQVALEAYLKSGVDSLDLVVVGTGSLSQELRRRAGDNPRVHFLDYVAPHQLDWYYRQASAVLAPALWPEMGNQTVLSALSCGTPILAANRGCLPEMVEKHQAGLMFDDIDGLAENMRRFQEEDFRKSFQPAARQAWKNEYTPQVFKENYLGLVKKLL